MKDSFRALLDAVCIAMNIAVAPTDNEDENIEMVMGRIRYILEELDEEDVDMNVLFETVRDGIRDGLPLEVLVLLLERFPELATTRHPFTGRFLLHSCCACDASVSVIQFLLETTPEAVRARDVEGKLPVQLACPLDSYFDDPDTDTVTSLLSLYPEAAQSLVAPLVNENGDDGWWELQRAICYGESTTERIQSLLVASEGVIEMSHLLDTLRASLERNSFSMQVLELLIKYIPALATTKHGETGELLLHIVCEYTWCADSMKRIRRVLERNPDAIHTADAQGMLPLHKALIGVKTYLQVAVLLFLHYPDAIGIRAGDNGMLPLHFAIEQGAPPEVIVYLLDSFPKAAEYTTNKNEIALHLACEFNSSLAIVKRLVDAYPKGVNRACDSGRLPLHQICAHKEHMMHKDLNGCTIDHDGSVTIREPNGSSAVVSFLMKCYPDGVKAKDKHGQCPLHVACSGSTDRASLQVVYLLTVANPVICSVRDCRGRLPLHYACLTGMPSMMLQLLVDCYQEEKAEQASTRRNGLSVADNIGKIPLHYAARGEYQSAHALQFLVERYPDGALVADKNGRLPLHDACFSVNASLERIRVLVEASVFSIVCESSSGMTPIQLACLNRHFVDDTKTMRYLFNKQNEALEALREAVEEVLEWDIGLPDLVIARIWRFARPETLGWKHVGWHSSGS